MVSYTSAAAQIATAIKATLDTFSISRIDQLPTIRSIKQLKLELCTMASAIESAKTGGKFGHMYVILTEEEYRKATGNKTATVGKLTKPPDVNPKFKTVKKEELTRYVAMELENETKMAMIAYITQEEVSKEIARRMVDSIDIEFIEELKNEYTGFANETPKTFIIHMEKEYCESTIDDKLKALKEFEVPWDQVTPFGTWITRLGREKDKCEEAGVNIDDEHMVLTIASNAMKCALFTQQDHEGYNNLATKDLASVTTYWVKKYKAHKKFNRDQSATNEYESAAYTMEPPPNSVPTEVNTYVSALEDIIARQMVDREDALTINTTTATPATSMAGLAAEVSRLATLVSTLTATNGGGGGGGGSGGGERRRGQRGKDKDGNPLPKCPHCNKPATHAPDECFSLAKNEEKRKAAGFENGKFTNKKEE
jgi:hypothetical protein